MDTAAVSTGRWVARLAVRTGAALLDLALPHQCPACGERVASAGFCAPCWMALPFLSGPACARCDIPLEAGEGDGAWCGACLQSPPPYVRVHTPLAYDAVTRGIVLRLKYARRPATARLMARMMLPVVPREDGDALLLPVPLHRWRLWRRGFNQSVELARHLSAATGLRLLPDTLRRTRATPPLRGLGRRARDQAVRAAFAVDPARRSLIAGRVVLLVDDVFTSGATAAACTRALLRAGAARVEVVAFARVLDDAGKIDTGLPPPDIGMAAETRRAA
jgi:ComF family protein